VLGHHHRQLQKLKLVPLFFSGAEGQQEEARLKEDFFPSNFLLQENL
jgi:hypothetical protein